MKKTLVALAVTAFAASATAGVDLYNQDGTKVSTYGRVEITGVKDTEKVKDQKTTGHSDLVNNTRLGLDVKQNITEDFYGLARLEIRFDKDGDRAYAKRAYAGLGYKDQVRFTAGRQLLIGDDIGRIGLDNYYGVGSSVKFAKGVEGWGILNDAADRAVRFDYTAVPGLTLSADYTFASSRDANGDVSVGSVKNGYGVGGVYEFEAGQGTASVSLGYSHNDLVAGYSYVDTTTTPETVVTVRTSDKAERDGVYGGFNYVINNVKFGVDGGFGTTKVGSEKDKLSFVRTGLRYDIPDSKAGVYGNYGYAVLKESGESKKNKAHRYMLGTDYAFSKGVLVYLEGKLDKVRPADAAKRTDKGIALGLKVHW